METPTPTPHIISDIDIIINVTVLYRCCNASGFPDHSWKLCPTHADDGPVLSESFWLCMILHCHLRFCGSQKALFIGRKTSESHPLANWHVSVMCHYFRAPKGFPKVVFQKPSDPLPTLGLEGPPPTTYLHGNKTVGCHGCHHQCLLREVLFFL